MHYKHKFGQELESILEKAAKNPQLLHNFLKDILSPNEYKELGIRWQIVKQLDKGVSQREIAKKLQVSIATVTRGSRVLINKKGGFNAILQKKI
ncbi:MAG: Trp family transcriptional regulator [Patescibacteria group bacterium]